LFDYTPFSVSEVFVLLTNKTASLRNQFPMFRDKWLSWNVGDWLLSDAEFIIRKNGYLDYIAAKTSKTQYEDGVTARCIEFTPLEVDCTYAAHSTIKIQKEIRTKWLEL